MQPATRQRLALLLGGTGLACPVGLVVIVVLLRLQIITFHDDMTGFKAVGFFLTWALCLLPAGLLASGLGLCLVSRSRLALAGLVLNLGLLVPGLLLFW